MAIHRTGTNDMRGHIAVLDLGQNLAAGIDKDGAEGVVAVGQGAAGDLERAALTPNGGVEPRQCIYVRAVIHIDRLVAVGSAPWPAAIGQSKCYD